MAHILGGSRAISSRNGEGSVRFRMPPRRRVFRGLTSAGRKVRGLRKKGRRRAFRQRMRIKKKILEKKTY